VLFAVTARALSDCRVLLKIITVSKVSQIGQALQAISCDRGQQQAAGWGPLSMLTSTTAGGTPGPSRSAGQLQPLQMAADLRRAQGLACSGAGVSSSQGPAIARRLAP